MDKNKIKEIYVALQGCYRTAPQGHYFTSNERELVVFYHSNIQELNKNTGENFDIYKIKTSETMRRGYSSSQMSASGEEYRSKLNALISVLHTKYFSDDTNPFASSPSTVISQSQHQHQSQSMVLEIQDQLDKKFYTGNLDEKEKSFIEKIKVVLPTIKNTLDLINLITTTAKNTGIDIHQLSKIFGL